MGKCAGFCFIICSRFQTTVSRILNSPIRISTCKICHMRDFLKLVSSQSGNIRGFLASVPSVFHGTATLSSNIVQVQMCRQITGWPLRDWKWESNVYVRWRGNSSNLFRYCPNQRSLFLWFIIFYKGQLIEYYSIFGEWYFYVITLGFVKLSVWKS